MMDNDHELRTQDLVAGYRTYAEPAGLELEATSEAPATTPACAFVGSVLTSFQVGNNLARGWGWANKGGGAHP